MTKAWLPSTIWRMRFSDFFQVFRDEGMRGIEVVVEAVLNGRPDGELGPWKKLGYCLCHHMRGRMS